MPAAVDGRSHDDVGHDRLHGLGPEGAAGLGIEPADLRDHVGEIVVVHAAEPPQRREFATRQKGKVGDQRGHRRIEAVLVAQLRRQTFGEVARADAGRIEGLDDGEHRFHARRGDAQAPGDLGDVVAAVAGLVDRIDQHFADHPVGPGGAGDRKLRGEVVAQRATRRDISFEVGGIAVRAAARRRTGPCCRGQALVVTRGGRVAWRPGVEGVADLGAEVAFEGVDVGREPVAGPGVVRPSGGERIVEGVDGGRLVLDGRLFGTFQQGIAVEFLLHERGQLDVRELQQADRLQELRRHYQGLPLTHDETRG